MVRRIASLEDGTNLCNFVWRGAKRKIQPAQENGPYTAAIEKAAMNTIGESRLSLERTLMRASLR